MLIEFPNESSLDLERRYDDFVYIIDTAFDEYIEKGWDITSAADKTIYDVEAMMKDDFSTIIVNVHLCYLFAKNDIEEFFIEIYHDIRDIYNMSILEIPNLVKETESQKIISELKSKTQKIIDYASTLDSRDVI